jgi:hypothetical protein
MHITAARLYHPAPWGWLYSYRIVLVLLRMLELECRALYFLLRAPLLIAWTRLPGLRGLRPPYRDLAEVLAPSKARPSLLVGEGQLGSHLLSAKGAPEIAQLATALRADTKPPSRFWGLAGCILRGYFTELGPAFIKFGQIMSMREEVTSLYQGGTPIATRQFASYGVQRDQEDPGERTGPTSGGGL